MLREVSMIELTLPAGSLQSALQAFEGGADAVYLGLRSFSARKYATNFSFDELAQLKTLCVQKQKNVYVTLNTLLDDQELEHMREIIRRLTFIQPDGIIVQDLGLARMIAQEFPSLALHCSTQLAVHTVDGVKALQSIGFSRIVLSRELTFAEISRIRIACPDVSLKVFIHGAMCYGFSGLCMASHCITGRSANRGECAQICRTWFSNKERDGYFFSLADLAIGQEVTKLRDLGIDSLKIEGRMKSPAYVRFAAQYYRMILDGVSESSAINQARENMEAQFARESGKGWMFGYGKESPIENRHTPPLITNQYPGHCGFRIGTVVQGRDVGDSDVVSVLLEHDISLRDGLLWLFDSGSGIDEPQKFGLHSMTDAQGRPLYTAQQGMQVNIKVPYSAPMKQGDSLFCVSRHNLNLADISEMGILPYRFPVDVQATFTQNAVALRAGNLPTWISPFEVKTYPLDIQRAHRPQQVRSNLEKLFSTPGEGLVTLGKLEIIFPEDFTEEQVFFPLSQMKEIRRTWYSWLNQILQEHLTKPIHPSLEPTKRGEQLPLRREISPPSDAIIPWVNLTEVVEALTKGTPVEHLLAVIDSTVYIPLAPITFNEPEQYEMLETLIRTISLPVRIGLNNISHIKWAQSHPDIPCFIDVYLYMTNRLSVELLLAETPNSVGIYRWIERPVQDTSSWPMVASTAIEPHEPFPLPLFISRACYRYDALQLPCEGCPRFGNWTIEQNGKTYTVAVRDCITMVLEKPE